MSIQYACDRCKEAAPVKSWETSDRPGGLPDGLKRYGPFHLCVNCAAKLKSFVEEPKLWHRSDE